MSEGRVELAGWDCAHDSVIVLESPGECVKTQIAWPPTPGFLIREVRGGAWEWAYLTMPRCCFWWSRDALWEPAAQTSPGAGPARLPGAHWHVEDTGSCVRWGSLAGTEGEWLLVQLCLLHLPSQKETPCVRLLQNREVLLILVLLVTLYCLSSTSWFHGQVRKRVSEGGGKEKERMG